MSSNWKEVIEKNSGRKLYNAEELQQLLQKRDWVSELLSEWVREFVVSREAIASKNVQSIPTLPTYTPLYGQSLVWT